MGFLRLLLAFSVAYGHSGYGQSGNPIFHVFFINASSAVVCFFTISGFYMAYVINEKYKSVDQWQKKFLLNRCLRLYPAYFVILVLCLIFLIYTGASNFVTGIKGISASYNALIGFLNFSIVGQDIYIIYLLLRKIDPFTAMPIAQAWSVAVELELYLAAACLFSTRSGLLKALGIGLALRLIMKYSGWIVTPIGCMLVFNVFVFFAMGGCSYILYKKIETWPWARRALCAGFMIAALVAASWRYDGFWQIEARSDDYHCTLFYSGLALAVPFIFSLSQKSRLDNLLGNLSYPAYLGHIFVFNVVRYLRTYTGIKYFATHTFYIVSALILVFSYAIYKWVEEPIQKIRKRIVAQ